MCIYDVRSPSILHVISAESSSSSEDDDEEEEDEEKEVVPKKAIRKSSVEESDESSSSEDEVSKKKAPRRSSAKEEEKNNKRPRESVADEPLNKRAKETAKSSDPVTIRESVIQPPVAAPVKPAPTITPVQRIEPHVDQMDVVQETSRAKTESSSSDESSDEEPTPVKLAGKPIENISNRVEDVQKKAGEIVVETVNKAEKLAEELPAKAAAKMAGKTASSKKVAESESEEESIDFESPKETNKQNLITESVKSLTQDVKNVVQTVASEVKSVMLQTDVASGPSVEELQIKLRDSERLRQKLEADIYNERERLKESERLVRELREKCETVPKQVCRRRHWFPAFLICSR